jgi:hypothetical protein
MLDEPPLRVRTHGDDPGASGRDVAGGVWRIMIEALLRGGEKGLRMNVALRAGQIPVFLP